MAVVTPARVVSGIRLELLADHLELTSAIASWHVPDVSDPSFEFWQRQLHLEAGRGGVPSVWVALEGDAPIGSVSLVRHNLPSRTDLGPWLAGLYVVADRRQRGIGTALVRRCEEEARNAGMCRLYLYTSTAEDFYAGVGWVKVDEGRHESKSVAIMARDLRR
jgi:predicted N-acetyltransferase YhbS